jgi:hypothetical protein
LSQTECQRAFGHENVDDVIVLRVNCLQVDSLDLIQLVDLVFNLLLLYLQGSFTGRIEMLLLLLFDDLTRLELFLLSHQDENLEVVSDAIALDNTREFFASAFFDMAFLVHPKLIEQLVVLFTAVERDSVGIDLLLILSIACSWRRFSWVLVGDLNRWGFGFHLHVVLVVLLDNLELLEHFGQKGYSVFKVQFSRVSSEKFDGSDLRGDGHLVGVSVEEDLNVDVSVLQMKRN